MMNLGTWFKKTEASEGDEMKITVVVNTREGQQKYNFATNNDFLSFMNDYKWVNYRIEDYFPYDDHLVLVMKK